MVCTLTTPSLAQIIELDTVVIRPIKYKYIYEVMEDDIDQSVKDLQMKLATFYVTKQEYYNDKYDNYNVSKAAVATCDTNGELLRTIEHFKNVKLPLVISRALVEQFPKWIVEKDIYKVSYSGPKWESKKTYTLKLTKSGKAIRVKTDEEGNFL